jgi:thiopeptide-type bacteriocin biosynthesis protein
VAEHPGAGPAGLLAGPGPADGAWVSAHVFYQGDPDRLLLDAVDPLVTELAGRELVADWFFLRYWDGGTHVRLRVRPPEAGSAGEVRDVIGERLAEYLRLYPSPDRISADDYARLARVLAGGEGVTGYAEQPYPNNSVAFLPYRPEHDRYGHGTTLAAVERHFGESSRLALSLLRAGLPAGRRETAGYSLVLLTWLCAEPDPARLAGWATETALAWGGGPTGAVGADARAFDERFARRRDQLVTVARQVRVAAAQLDHDPPGAGMLGHWGRSVVRLRAALDGRRPVRPVLDICAHLVCNRLGISVPEECYLRYLAARAVATIAEEGS